MTQVPKKVRQLKEENDSWRKALEFMVHENAMLKNRLADMLKNNTSIGKMFLDDAEQYQNLFLRQDESIKLLRGDVAAFDRLLQREVYEDGQIIKTVLHKYVQLRKDIAQAQIEFGKMKTQFISFASEES